jgi:hypothetical protein
VDVPKSAYEKLEQAKAEGISKKTFLTRAITVAHWFNNRASFKATSEAVVPHEMLKAFREDVRQKGADSAQLFEIDQAIEVFNKILKRLEEKGEK